MAKQDLETKVLNSIHDTSGGERGTEPGGRNPIENVFLSDRRSNRLLTNTPPDITISTNADHISVISIQNDSNSIYRPFCDPLRPLASSSLPRDSYDVSYPLHAVFTFLLRRPRTS